MQAASCTYRIALGPRADAHGFSLHAGVRCGAHQRKKLEHLCRHITRPAIANKRFKRVFDIDLEHCPQCGGDLKIIAAIEELAVTACRAGDRVADGEKGYLISYSIFD